MTHQGRRLTLDEKLQLSDAVETAISVVIDTVVSAHGVADACPCCVGRALAGAMAKLMGYHAAPGVNGLEEMEAYLQLVAGAVQLGQAQRAMEAVDRGDETGAFAAMPTFGRPS